MIGEYCAKNEHQIENRILDIRIRWSFLVVDSFSSCWAALCFRSDRKLGG